MKMLSACLLLLPFISCTQVQDTENDAVIEQKIETLLSRMTLEEKMKNDPELAKKVMANVENFITTYTATSVRPGRVCSWLISLDENGDIEGMYFL